MSSKPWVGKTVVIVDDSVSVREELTSIFRAIGMQVVGVAENGVVGFDMVRQHKPELVSLDVIMPEMDGIECFRKVRAFDANIKCVMITWLGSEAKILDNLKDLIAPHLFQPKPVNAADLEARLEKIWFPQLQVVAKAPTAKTPLDETDAAFRDLGIKVS